MKVSQIKYTTLFNYAVKVWGLTWSEYHKYFFKFNAIKFNGMTETFYLEDLENEIDDEILPPLWNDSYGKAMNIIRHFMLDNGYNELKFYGH
jgi:hypothetical protein